MAQAGATLISLGRKPGREATDKIYDYTELDFTIMIHKMLQKYLPANSPPKPSCATILLITLKVEEET